MRIDVDAVIDADGAYLLTIRSPHRTDRITATAARVGDARSAARGAASRHQNTGGIVGIGTFHLSRTDVGPDGQYVLLDDGEIGTASWLGADWAWLVTTRTGAGMCATEDLTFGDEPQSAERAELDAWSARPQVADAVDADRLQQLRPDGVSASVFAVPEARSWDIAVTPA